MIESDVQRLVDQPTLAKFLANAGVLVPVPKHGRHLQDSLWVPEKIAEAMHKRGVGSSVTPFLERIKPVPQSTGKTSAADRPTPETHLSSLGLKLPLDLPLSLPSRVTLVDDVVTRGSTLLGCAARLRSAQPKIQVQAFALCRVERGRQLRHVAAMRDPKIETIKKDGSKVRRF